LFQDGNHQQKGGDEPQQVDGESEGLVWFCLMGLLVYSKVMHVLLECSTLHEQGPMHGTIVMMEVGRI
jgi:hypothetical protein